MNILVTGGSSGLGAAIVENLASLENVNIIFTYSSSKDKADNLCNNYSNVRAFHVDYTNSNSVDEFTRIIPSLNIDVLINNAWVGSPNGTYFHKTEIADFANSFNTNVLPLIKISKSCLVFFRKRKDGKVITVLTSYLLNLPPMGFSVYTATKAYIEQLTKCWSREYNQYGITSNSVSPEYMTTSFADVEDYVVENMIANHPLKRLIDPKEVAVVVANLVFASKHVNGVNIPINAAQSILK